MRIFDMDYFLSLAFQNRVLFLLSLAIVFLLICSVIFAAYSILLRIRNNRKAAHWARLETAWEQAILEVLSGEKEPSDLQQRVGRKDTLYFVDFVMRYARRLRGQEREILTELVRPFLSRITERTVGGDAERRARAVQTISTLGFEEYTDRIIAALDDPSPLVAMIAARALARKEHPQHAVPVLKRLHRFQGWSRNYLSTMLSAVGPQIAPALRETLMDAGQPPQARAVAAEALRELNEFRAADDAVKVLETEQDRDLLASSLRLLAQTGRPEHLPAIRSLLGSPDFVVRAQAAGALGAIGDHQDIPLLREAFEDPSQWVAIQAAQGLKESGGVQTLKEIADSDHPRADLAKQVLMGEN